MQWSQLKKRVEALFADAIKGRIELHTTRYHKAPDDMGRAWVTIDGQEVINMCSFAALVAEGEEARRLQEASGCTDFRNPDHRDGYYRALAEAYATRHAKTIFSRDELHEALFQYLNLSIDQILTSPNPIIRAIGMLDRRLGKRRLAALDITQEHPLVQRIYQFRCETEHLPIRSEGGKP